MPVRLYLVLNVHVFVSRRRRPDPGAAPLQLLVERREVLDLEIQTKVFKYYIPGRASGRGPSVLVEKDLNLFIDESDLWETAPNWESDPSADDTEIEEIPNED